MEQEKDIVERLRVWEDTAETFHGARTLREAADEIERLRDMLLERGQECYELRARIREVGCVYDTIIYTPQHHSLTISSETRSWCRTHGWLCPNLGHQRGSADIDFSQPVVTHKKRYE